MGGRQPVRERIFIRHYLAGTSVTQAWEYAVSATPHDGSNSGGAAGYRFLETVAAQELIKQEAERRYGVTVAGPDETLAEISRIAFSDIGDAFGPDGAILPINQMPTTIRRALTSVEMCTDKETGAALPAPKKIAITSKIAALEQLCKIHRLYEQSVTVVVGSMTQEELVARARELIAKQTQPVLEAKPAVKESSHE